MVVLRGRFRSYPASIQIKFEVQMREHLFVLHFRVGPHLLHFCILFERVLQLCKQLLNRWLVFSLPLDLTGLLLGDSLVEGAGEVVLVDHLSQILNNLLLELLSLDSPWCQRGNHGLLLLLGPGSDCDA